MHRITRVAVLGSTILFVAACAKKEEPAKDTTAAMTPAPAPAAAPTIALADAAGQWQFASTPMAGKDTSPTKFTLNAKTDTMGWTMAFPDKQVVPLKVSVSGDSVQLVSGEFKSQRRKGMKVKTETVLRMQGGKLAGMTNAHYMTKGADSTLQLRTEGSKMP
jgi:glucose/arabinose dehydrogenase